jgi:hypothetical protein
LLREFLNVENGDWPLLLGWTLGLMMPEGPYPVLVLTGEHGSAKSTMVKVLRLLVDPSTIPLRSLSRNEHDLAIAARNSWVIAFDNVSILSPWLSDAICRLATGGGFATRELYTDADEVLFDSKRPVVLNGIGDIATQSDLLDRAIIITLPIISDNKRRTEEKLWGEFESVRPMIMSTLLDAVVLALRDVKSVTLGASPRMADFAKWVVAAAPALGMIGQEFLDAYQRNRYGVHELVLESSPVGAEIISLAAGLPIGCEWKGTATELLDELNGKVNESVQRRKDWPKTARLLSGTLRRLAPNLRATGVEVKWGGEGSGRTRRRTVSVRKGPHSSDPSDPSDPPDTNGIIKWGGKIESGTMEPPADQVHRDDGADGDDGKPTHSNTSATFGAVLGMTGEAAIELWRSKGAPAIELNTGETCSDLSVLLSCRSVHMRHLVAVRKWIDESDKISK